MTTGQPIRFPSDRNKYNNEYMESLQLQINLNQTNLEANRLYKQTGQLPASTQMMDTRSNEEKLMDVHNLKQSIISDLAPIAEPMFASAVIQGVIDSPLNVNNSLFRYLAQNAQTFAQTLSKKYKFGIAGDANDVMIMVQFLEDAYNKTKNTFQSIKGYINSNTNEGNKTRSNILSANDTDNLITELKDLLKRLTYIGNIPASSANDIINLQTLLTDIIEFLPSSEQMKVIIDKIIETQNAIGILNAPIDPNYGEFLPGGVAESVFKILQTIPKLSSVQTLIDRLERAIRDRDNRVIREVSRNMINLFTQFNTPENRALLTQFKNEYTNRAQREINQARRISEIQTTQTIRNETIREQNERKAQRVYVVNAATDPIPVTGNMGLGPPGGYVDFEGDGDNVSDFSGLQSAASTGSQRSGLSGLQSVVSAGSQMSGDFIPPIQPPVQPDVLSVASGYRPVVDRDNYITTNVNLLSSDGVRALANKMEKSPRISQNDRNGLAEMLRQYNVIPLNDAKEYIISILHNLSELNYNPSINPPRNFFDIGGPAGVSGLGLKKPKKGRGLYSPFGDSEINHKNLENNILTLRRKSKTNYMDLPSKHISKHMKNILHSIVGGKIANFEDIQNLNDEERNYLNKIIKKSNLQDRLSVPAPSKDQADKDSHGWEVMRGEIMAGNDSHELVKKFKILTMKLTRQGLLPKNEVMELFQDLVNLGY